MQRVLLPLACALAFGVGLFATSSIDDASAQERRRATVANMDLDLLRENLIKIWIIDESSHRYNQQNIAETSFNLMLPLEKTGDPEVDEENRLARRKAIFQLDNWLRLELDGAIEIIDICQRVLGKNAPKSGDKKALTKILGREMPVDIVWSGISVADAINDFSRKANVKVEFPGLPKGVQQELNITAPAGFTIGQVLDLMAEYGSIEWKYVDGVFHFEYIG